MFTPPPPEPEKKPEETAAEDDKDMTAIAERFVELGLDSWEALACAWDGLSPSEVREFLRRNPKCDVRTAVAILL